MESTLHGNQKYMRVHIYSIIIILSSNLFFTQELLGTMLALRCIEREDKQCHGSYVIEREKDDPS
jgi:hypothetical protein